MSLTSPLNPLKENHRNTSTKFPFPDLRPIFPPRRFFHFYILRKRQQIPGANLPGVFFLFFSFPPSPIYSTRTSVLFPFRERRRGWKKKKKSRGKKGREKRRKNKKEKEERRKKRGKYETPENLLAQHRHRSVQRGWGSLKNCKSGKFTAQSGNHQMFNVGGNNVGAR